MKKLSLVILSIFLFILTACGSKNEDNNTEKKIELKMGIVPGIQSNEYKSIQYLSDYLKKESEGKLTLKIYPDSQLGDDREMLEQVSAGQLDLALAESGRLGLWIKEAEIFQLPYAFKNFDHLIDVLFNSNSGKKIIKKAKLEKGWIIVANAYNGTRQTTSNKVINSLDDMKGMKLRVPNAQANLDFASYIGASPTPMAFTETYLGLQTNAVDGQENPLSAIKTSKFYEVQKYIALTNHIINDQCYIISSKTMEKIPDDLRNILENGIKETAKYHTNLFIEDEKNLLNFFQNQGLVVTSPDLSSVPEKMKPIYDRYVKANGELGKELFDVINSSN